MIHQILGLKIIMVLMVMIEVVLVLEPPNYTPQINFGRDRKYWEFQTSQHEHTESPMSLFSSDIIKLVLLILLLLVLQLAMEKVLWVLGLLNFPPINIIVG